MAVRRLLAALLVALVVSGAFTYLLAKRLTKSRAATHTLKYVGAVHDLEAGEVVRAEDLKVISWPADAPIEGAVPGPGDAIGRAALTPLAANQPMLAKQLSPVGGVGLSGRIPDGMRAISLRSDQVVGVAGFLMPGTHTDVLVTYRSPASSDAVTSTVLQNAEVLAAGQKTQPDPEGKPATVDVVTLLVTPEEAERVVLASTQGTVHFVLRNGADRRETTPAPINTVALGLGAKAPQEFGPPRSAPRSRKLTRSGKPAAKKTTARAVPVPAHYSVTVIRGDKESVATF